MPKLASKDVIYIIPTIELAGVKNVVLLPSSAEDSDKAEFTSLDTTLQTLVPGITLAIISGGIEEGETTEEAAIREILEEAKLAARPDSLSNSLVTGKMLQVRDNTVTLLTVQAGYELHLSQEELLDLQQLGAVVMPWLDVLTSKDPIRSSTRWALHKNKQ